MKPRSKVCSRAAIVVLALAAAAIGSAQFRGFQAVAALPAEPLSLKPGETASMSLILRVRSGYHINSNRPNEDYLIPTSLVWDAAPLEVVSVKYPPAENQSFDFSEEPMSVYSGEVVIETTLRAPPDWTSAAREIPGRLRYQACNDKACLAPTSLDVKAFIR